MNGKQKETWRNCVEWAASMELPGESAAITAGMILWANAQMGRNGVNVSDLQRPTSNEGGHDQPANEPDTEAS